MQPRQRVRSDSSKPPSRNTAALILFGRSAYITMALSFGCIGFYGGIVLSGDSYNPHSYAMGAGMLFAADRKSVV